MTILVGVLCEDGAVIGSDSSVTLDHSGYNTIEQVCPDKLSIIGKRFIVAGTGSVGHFQRFCFVLENGLRDAITQNVEITAPAIELARQLAEHTKINFD